MDGRRKVKEPQKVAFVSGSTQGVGLAIAQKLISDGFKVVQNSRKAIPTEKLIGSLHIPADVTQETDCQKIISSITSDFGRLDLLVCNVGNGSAPKDLASGEAIWNDSLRVNLLGATLLTEASINLLLASQGNVVFISSICGQDPTINAPVSYSVAKAASDHYMRVMAARYGARGVRFNSVAPGNVLFGESAWERKLRDDRAATKKYIEEKVPMGVFISPEDVAATVSFLASANARFITGTVIPVDGGQSL